MRQQQYEKALKAIIADVSRTLPDVLMLAKEVVAAEDPRTAFAAAIDAARMQSQVLGRIRDLARAALEEPPVK